MRGVVPCVFLLLITSLSPVASNPLASSSDGVYSDNPSLSEIASCQTSVDAPEDSENPFYQDQAKRLKSRDGYDLWGLLGTPKKVSSSKSKLCPVRPGRSTPEKSPAAAPRGDHDDPHPDEFYWNGKCNFPSHKRALCCIGEPIRVDGKRIDATDCMLFHYRHPLCISPDLGIGWSYCCKDIVNDVGIDCIPINGLT